MGRWKGSTIMMFTYPKEIDTKRGRTIALFLPLFLLSDTLCWEIIRNVFIPFLMSCKQNFIRNTIHFTLGQGLQEWTYWSCRSRVTDCRIYLVLKGAR